MDNYVFFEKLFKAHYTELCREARFFLKDQDEAEDLVQDIFITLWKNNKNDLDKFNIAYLNTAVKNRCISKLRKKNSVFSIDDPSIEKEISINDNTEEQTELISKAESLKEAIDQLLPERCRIIFYACKLEGKSYAEVAASLNISIKTVENQMGKALKLIRQLIQTRPDLTLILILSLFSQNHFLN